jgi:hypothetical protein
MLILITMNQINFPQSRFLETTSFLEMKEPYGTLTYLDMVVTKPATENEYAEVGLKVFTEYVQSVEKQLNMTVPLTTSEDLAGIGVDTEAGVYTTLIHQMQTDVERSLYSEYRARGIGSFESTYNWKQKKLNKWFGIKFPTYVKVEDPADIVKKMTLYSNIIAAKSRMGAANFCVVNSSIGAILQDSPAFTFPGKHPVWISANSQPIQYVGSIYNMEVYVNSTLGWKDNTIVLGRKTQKGNNGAYTCVHGIEIDSVEIEYPNREKKYRLSTKFNQIFVGKKVNAFYCTIEVIFGKKPLWKRLLGV